MLHFKLTFMENEKKPECTIFTVIKCSSDLPFDPFFLNLILVDELEASQIIGKHSTTGLCPQPGTALYLETKSYSMLPMGP